MNDVTRRFIETYKEMGLTGYRMGKKCPSITKQKISNIIGFYIIFAVLE